MSYLPFTCAKVKSQSFSWNAFLSTQVFDVSINQSTHLYFLILVRMPNDCSVMRNDYLNIAYFEKGQIIFVLAGGGKCVG